MPRPVVRHSGSDTPPQDPVQSSVQCLICVESGHSNPDSFPADEPVYTRLRRHVSLFHFNNYQPYTCKSCGQKTGCRKLAFTPEWCCTSYKQHETQLEKPSPETQLPGLEAMIDLIVHQSVLVFHHGMNVQNVTTQMERALHRFVADHPDPSAVLPAESRDERSDSLPPATPQSNRSNDESITTAAAESDSRISTPASTVFVQYKCMECGDVSRKPSSFLNHYLDHIEHHAPRYCKHPECEGVEGAKFIMFVDAEEHFKNVHKTGKRKFKPFDKSKMPYVVGAVKVLNENGISRSTIEDMSLIPESILDEVYGSNED